MNRLKLLLAIPLFFLVACAQVPKESVELSATVGRDMAEMKEAHVNLINLVYEQHQTRINNFIDDVYLPWQVQQSLADHAIKQEILNAIETASRTDITGQAQKDALEIIEIFLTETHNEVESYRRSKLAPIQAQHQQLLKNVNDSYARIHYANSIVTGHLASVVKVHDAQNDLLEKVDLADLRTQVGVKFSGLNSDISTLIAKAKGQEAKLDDIITQFEEALSK